MAGKRFRKAVGRKLVKRYRRTRIARKPVAFTRSLNSFPRSGGFPKMMKMSHRYVDQITVTSTTGVAGIYQFRCNGMYDPDITATGHQPLYFDQMSAIYNHFCVIGSKIKIKTLPNAATAGVAYSICCFINDDSTVTNLNIPDCVEQRKAVSKVAGGISAIPTYLTTKWSAKKFFGRNPLSNTDLQGSGSGDPAEQSVYTIVVAANDKASTVVASLLVEVDYIAVWKETKDIAAS